MKNIKKNYNKNGISQKVKYLFGDTAVLSFPIPDTVNDVLIEKHFIYIGSIVGKTGRPIATLTTEMDGGMILQYQNCMFNDYIDTEKYPFSDTPDYVTNSITTDDIKNYTDQLIDCYQTVRKVAFKDSLTDDEKVAVETYKDLFKKMVSSTLMPYYKALGNKFFEWLEWKD